MLKGNHDYWWNTISKMNKFLQENDIKTINFLHNNSYNYEDFIICGTRGWIDSDDEENIRILKRELLRLELSLNTSTENCGDKKIIVLMHYPPFIENASDVNFIELMNKYNVKYCIYGHIHGKQDAEIQHIENCNIEFRLVSCDYLNFNLLKIF